MELLANLVRVFVLAVASWAAAGLAGAQDVHDFHFSGFEADFYLSKDEEDRARLRVVETITAEFPAFDQNRGLARAIPATFDGHPVSFELEFVTRNGEPEPIYAQYTERGNEIIETGTDDFVHGTQVYTFAYTLRDVIRGTPAGQEFYWDVNGTEWLQYFEAVTARVHLDESVKDLFTGATRCYQGPLGSETPCAGAEQDGDMIVFRSEGGLGPGETLSVVLDFQPGAFTLYTEGFAGVLRALGALLATALAIMASAQVVRIRYFVGRDAASEGAVRMAHQPPRGITFLEASAIYRRAGERDLLPALIVHLATRGHLRVIEREKKGTFSTSTQYTVELLDPRGLHEDEQPFVEALFGSLEAGGLYTFDRSDWALSKRLHKLQESLRKAVVDRGYRREVSVGWTPFLLATAALLIGGAVSITLPSNALTEWRAIGLFAGIGGLGFVFSASMGIRPLTPKGRRVYDYLDGLRLYMKSDGALRLQILQRTEGGKTTPIEWGNPGQVLELHERLLPYAIMFGLDRSWLGHLSVQYEAQSRNPRWYYGPRPWEPDRFASSITALSSSVSHVSSPSSSGGGAGGGGGGGGGGGR